jgi:predicted nucleic acid-binding protein
MAIERSRSRPQLKVALDTNVLFDLAAGENFAATVLEILRENEIDVFVPPTVLMELLFEEEHCVEPAKGALATRALNNVHDLWKLRQVRLEPSQEAIAKSFAAALHAKGLVDAREINDCFILAEATQIPVNYLLSSDNHLLSINRDKLHVLFEDKHVPKVEIIAARRVFKLFKGR